MNPKRLLIAVFISLLVTALIVLIVRISIIDDRTVDLTNIAFLKPPSVENGILNIALQKSQYDVRSYDVPHVNSEWEFKKSKVVNFEINLELGADQRVISKKILEDNRTNLVDYSYQTYKSSILRSLNLNHCVGANCYTHTLLKGSKLFVDLESKDSNKYFVFDINTLEKECEFSRKDFIGKLAHKLDVEKSEFNKKVSEIDFQIDSDKNTLFLRELLHYSGRTYLVKLPDCLRELILIDITDRNFQLAGSKVFLADLFNYGQIGLVKKMKSSIYDVSKKKFYKWSIKHNLYDIDTIKKELVFYELEESDSLKVWVYDIETRKVRDFSIFIPVNFDSE